MFIAENNILMYSFFWPKKYTFVQKHWVLCKNIVLSCKNLIFYSKKILCFLAKTYCFLHKIIYFGGKICYFAVNSCLFLKFFIFGARMTVSTRKIVKNPTTDEKNKHI